MDTATLTKIYKSNRKGLKTLLRDIKKSSTQCIQWYRSRGYKHINKYLFTAVKHNEVISKKQLVFFDEDEHASSSQLCVNILDTMFTSHKKNDIYYYRGLNNAGAGVIRSSLQNVGDEYHAKNYTSSSSDILVAQRFAIKFKRTKGSTDNFLILRFKIPSNIKTYDMANLPGSNPEAEVLITRDIKFKLIKQTDFAIQYEPKKLNRRMLDVELIN